MDRMVHICYTLLAVRFIGPSKNGSANNIRGPRLLFALLNCFCEGERRPEASDSWQQTVADGHIKLIHQMAEAPEVTAEECSRFKSRLIKDNDFQKLYLQEEEHYRMSGCLDDENRLRVRLVAQVARSACSVGPTWDSPRATPMQVNMDWEAIQFGLLGTAIVQAEKNPQRSTTVDLPRELIRSVVYRWTPRYRRSPAVTHRQRGLAWNVEAEMKFEDKRLDAGGHPSDMETIISLLSSAGGDDRWLEPWTKAAIEDRIRTEPGPSHLPRDQEGSSTTLTGSCITRQHPGAAAPSHISQMQNLQLIKSAIEDRASASTRASDNGASQGPPLVTGEENILLQASLYVQQDPKCAKEVGLLYGIQAINRIASIAPNADQTKIFVKSFTRSQGFQERCNKWLLYYRHRTPRVAWMDDRARRLEEAIRRVRGDAEPLPPRGPPLLPGEPLGDERTANLTYEHQEEQLKRSEGMIRPLRYADPVLEYQSAFQKFTRACLARRDIIKTSTRPS